MNILRGRLFKITIPVRNICGFLASWFLLSGYCMGPFLDAAKQAMFCCGARYTGCFIKRTGPTSAYTCLSWVTQGIVLRIRTSFIGLLCWYTGFCFKFFHFTMILFVFDNIYLLLWWSKWPLSLQVSFVCLFFMLAIKIFFSGECLLSVLSVF